MRTRSRHTTKADETLCSVTDCSAEAKTRGLCGAHYHKLRRYGDPTWNRPSGMTAFDVLEKVIGVELALEVIALRRSKGTEKQFDAYRAGLTAKVFQRASDPKRSAWEYVNRSRNRAELTQEYLHACVHYDAETGVFTARLPSGSRNEGDILGSVGSHGYLSIVVAGMSYLAHRLAWFYVHGVWPEIVDHIDRDRHNNRIANLRECTLLENAWNVTPIAGTVSGITGVNWFAARRKWVAKISSGGRSKTLGYYDDIVDAASARQMAVQADRGYFLNQRDGEQNA